VFEIDKEQFIKDAVTSESFDYDPNDPPIDDEVADDAIGLIWPMDCLPRWSHDSVRVTECDYTIGD
jgi:hypothetical protein